MPTDNPFINPGYDLQSETWEEFYESDEWWAWVQTQDVPDPQHQPWAYRAWVDSARRYFEEYNQAPPAEGPYEPHDDPQEPPPLPGPPSPPTGGLEDPWPDPLPDPAEEDDGRIGRVRGFGDESDSKSKRLNSRHYL